LRRCVAWNQPQPSARPGTGSPPGSPRQSSRYPAPSLSAPTPAASRTAAATPTRPACPYAEWTRKIGGRTITRRLTAAELTEYQPLFDNAKKLRALVAELQDLILEIIQTDSSRPGPEPGTRGPEMRAKPA